MHWCAPLSPSPVTVLVGAAAQSTRSCVCVCVCVCAAVRVLTRNPSAVVELNGMQVRAEQIEEAIIAAIAGAPGRRLEDLLTDPRRPHMTYGHHHHHHQSSSSSSSFGRGTGAPMLAPAWS